MNKLKFFHVITGKIVVVNCAQGIIKERQKDGTVQKRVVSRNKVMKHMWSQGYCRAGKHIVLSDFEKKMIEMAPAAIEKMNADIKAAEKAVVKQAEIPALAMTAPSQQQTTADRLNALRQRIQPT